MEWRDLDDDGFAHLMNDLADQALTSASTQREALGSLATMTADLDIEEEPLGSNDGVAVRYFMKGDRRLMWCAGSALKLAELVLLPLPPEGYWPNRNVARLWKNARRGGMTLGPAIVPEVGDLIVYGGAAGSDRGANHVDIVTTVMPVLRGVQLEVAGGNVANRFRRRPMPHSSPTIKGYIRLVAPR